MAKHHTKKHGSKKHHTKKHGSKKHGSKKDGSKKKHKTVKARGWIAHVKQYAEEHNMKFGDALSEAAKTYNK
jgi:hypothetical protein